MAIVRWSPFQELDVMRRQMDRLFDEMLAPSAPEAGQPTAAQWVPAVELRDDGDHLTLRAELPGVDSENLEVQVSREAVHIAGEHRFERKEENKDKGWLRSEFRYGRFQRVIGLPAPVVPDQTQATRRDGILTLTLAKAPEARNQLFKVNLDA